MSTLADIAVASASKQETIIDTLTEESVMLQDMRMIPSSNGWFHLAEEYSRLVGGNVIDPDGARPSMLAESVLRQKTLSVIGGVMKKGRDTVDAFGGPDEYFGRKMPGVLRRTGGDVESTLYYNSLRPFAFANDKLISAGGTGAALYSLTAVTWTDEEMCGLYDSRFGESGEFMTVTPINGGNFYEDPAAPGSMVYGQDARMFLGCNFLNPRYVAGVVNIDLSGDGLTAAMVCDVLEAARATPGRTFIYCRPEVKARLADLFKTAHLTVTSAEGNVSLDLESINGIRIRASRNLLPGTESEVTLD